MKRWRVKFHYPKKANSEYFDIKAETRQEAIGVATVEEKREPLYPDKSYFKVTAKPQREARL